MTGLTQLLYVIRKRCEESQSQNYVEMRKSWMSYFILVSDLS